MALSLEADLAKVSQDNISLVIDPVSKLYCRSNSSFRIALAHKLENHYAYKRLDSTIRPTCHIATSGMNAISSVMRQLTNAPGVYDILYMNELYCDSPRLFNFMSNQNPGKIYATPIDIHAQDSLCDTIDKINADYNARDEIDRILPHKVIVFYESCSNPHSIMFKFELISKIRASHDNVTFVCDNTWLTDVLYNPFADENNNADIVVLSLTKYYGGGKAIAGAILGQESFIELIEEYDKVYGVHVSNKNCSVILDMIGGLNKRLIISSGKTLKILEYLNMKACVDNSKIGQIYNPPMFGELCPSICTFTVRSSKSRVMKILNTVTAFHDRIPLITSFGGELSRVDPWPTVNNGYTHIRISIGYDENESDINAVYATIDSILSLL